LALLWLGDDTALYRKRWVSKWSYLFIMECLGNWPCPFTLLKLAEKRELASLTVNPPKGRAGNKMLNLLLHNYTLATFLQYNFALRLQLVVKKWPCTGSWDNVESSIDQQEASIATSANSGTPRGPQADPSRKLREFSPLTRGSLPLLHIYRNSIGSLSEVYRKSIGSLPELYRKSIGTLSEVSRKSIRTLSEVYRNSIGSLPELYRNSIGTLSELYRNSIGSAGVCVCPVAACARRAGCRPPPAPNPHRT
jgi:hypothetical protein